MSSRNLRHLRLFEAVAETRSLTQAAGRLHLSQPAVTQAIKKLEREMGGLLFERNRSGLSATARGELLFHRVQAAFAILDPVLGEISPRLRTCLTYAQLQALVAVTECENFTLAARQLGVAQPTVHRAITQVEQGGARSLFERTAFGILPTRLCRAFAQAARLAIYELDQAEEELAELDGGEAGCINIGAMPLARSVLLPAALAEFRAHYRTMAIRVMDGPYDVLLGELRRGKLDMLVGALREPAPIGDIKQDPLFDDSLALLCRPDHPLASSANVSIDQLLSYPWVVPQTGTPTRSTFEAIFEAGGREPPHRLIESGSLLLMRGLLLESDHLCCISHVQAKTECERGLLHRLVFDAGEAGRPIGITTRINWRPTSPQRKMLEILATVGAELKS